MIRILLVASLLSLPSLAASTNKTEKAVKAEKELKTEHQENKIIVKARDKGSKKESDFKVEREFPLMFANNRKARKQKGSSK
jgi:hypothetical protein